MMIIGYARVSTTEQNLDLRRYALQRAGSDKIIEGIGKRRQVARVLPLVGGCLWQAGMSQLGGGFLSLVGPHRLRPSEK
jgi:hypothetical protein